jgi:nicotinate-nucleotide--dimethylbenzimidazole phosphoribosyltransferase
MELLQKTVKAIEAPDDRIRAQARDRLGRLTMPHWALGRLMDLAEDLAAMRGTLAPEVSRKAVAVMAADHGVTREGVSQYPSEVTPQMVLNFVAGGAAVNALAGLAQAKVVVVDLGVAADLSATAAKGGILDRKVRMGTANMAQGPAMTRSEAVQSIERGIALADDLARTHDLLATGDMGIGNTTASAAILAALTGCPAAAATGRGTGIDEDRLKHKVAMIEKALEINRPDASDPIDVLAKVGGLEIGGIAGFILGCAARKKPVIVDGFISSAGALIAQALCPQSTAYMIAGHCSAENGHKLMLARLGKKALLDLDMRLGEGTGAVLAMNLVEAAQRILTRVATFEEAAVSGPT